MSIRQEKQARAAQDASEAARSDGSGALDMAEATNLGAAEDVPPAYSETHDSLSLHQAGFAAGARVTRKNVPGLQLLGRLG